MASPSASSTTLSIHSDDHHLGPAAEEGQIPGQEKQSIINALAPPRWELEGVVYDEHDNSFVLSDEYYLPAGEWSLSAPMRAAAHPDPRVLKAVLEHANELYSKRVAADLIQRRENGIPMSPSGCLAGGSYPLADMSLEFGPNSLRVSGSGDAGITTPLLEAIRFEHLENVKTLLDASANPNGVPLSVMDNYAAFFLRFRPQIPSYSDEVGDLASRTEFLELMDLPQLSRLTREEVEDRFCDGMAPFWCEEGFTPNDFYPNGGSIPSLVAAAKCESTDIFDELLNTGAEASFWLNRQYSLPEEPTESSISVSSPLHAAIEVGNLTMVRHLLDLKFNPNILPLTSPTRCYTPMMAMLFSPYCSKTIFDTLLSHPDIKPEIRTPVYQVHILHFIIARLDLEALQYVSSDPRIPLSSAGTTALGHTLLHVACMPPDSLHVQRRAEVVYRSIHETRDLSPANDPHTRFPPEFDGPLSEFEHHFKAQTAIIKYLWTNGIRDFENEDVHGNTALHYLAGCQSMNWELLNWLFENDKSGDVEKIWTTARNEVGATPGELADAAQRVRQERKSGWCLWFERHNSRVRGERKEGIWKGLLDGTNMGRRVGR